MAKAATNHHVVGHKGAKATRFHYVVALFCEKKKNKLRHPTKTGQAKFQLKYCPDRPDRALIQVGISWGSKNNFPSGFDGRWTWVSTAPPG